VAHERASTHPLGRYVLIVVVCSAGPIFFEGNYAQMRLPRRVFLSWTNLYIMLKTFVFNGIPWELVAVIGISLPYFLNGTYL
jgi:hypothetical protein